MSGESQKYSGDVKSFWTKNQLKCGWVWFYFSRVFLRLSAHSTTSPEESKPYFFNTSGEVVLCADNRRNTREKSIKLNHKETLLHIWWFIDNELPIICKSCSHHEDKHLIIVWLSWDELLIFIYNNVMYKWWWSLGHQRRISWTLYCDKHLILWWLSCGELIYHLTLIII